MQYKYNIIQDLYVYSENYENRNGSIIRKKLDSNHTDIRKLNKNKKTNELMKT